MRQQSDDAIPVARIEHHADVAPQGSHDPFRHSLRRNARKKQSLTEGHGGIDVSQRKHLDDDFRAAEIMPQASQVGFQTGFGRGIGHIPAAGN